MGIGDGGDGPLAVVVRSPTPPGVMPAAKAQVRGMRDRSRMSATPGGWFRDRVGGPLGYVRLRLHSRDRFRVGWRGHGFGGLASDRRQFGGVRGVRMREQTHNNKKPRASHPRSVMLPPGGGRVVRLPEVLEITGLSRTTIWRRGQDGSTGHNRATFARR